jgi:hypothetical protein
MRRSFTVQSHSRHASAESAGSTDSMKSLDRRLAPVGNIHIEPEGIEHLFR